MARSGEMPSKAMASKWVVFLCTASFCVGMFFTNRAQRGELISAESVMRHLDRYRQNHKWVNHNDPKSIKGPVQTSRENIGA